VIFNATVVPTANMASTTANKMNLDIGDPLEFAPSTMEHEGRISGAQ
jgi:hypothetical protein